MKTLDEKIKIGLEKKSRFWLDGPENKDCSLLLFMNNSG